MKTIVVTTQKELDDLPFKFEEFTNIEIKSDEIIKITIHRDFSQVKVYDSSRVVAWGSSQVKVYDSSRVVAWGSSQVNAYGSSRVVAYDSSRVDACGSSQVNAYGSSQVVARDSSQVSAWWSSQVVAYGSSRVGAYDSSQVVAYDSSQVVAYGSSQVEAHGSSRVEAHDSSRVEAGGSSRVEAGGSSRVVAHNTSSVIARGLSKVTAFNLSVVEAWDSSQVTSFERSNILVFSEFVSIKYLADYSTAKFIEVKDNILMKDETAKIIETPELNISFDTWLERGYVVADGIKRKFISKKEINGIEIFEVEAFLDKKTEYVVRRNGVFSHGETVEKAIESLRYKISDRDTSEFETWKLDTEITIEDAIQAYRAITGACEYGVREFCESIKIPEKLTPGSVIKLTEGKFGYKEFKEFFK